MEDRVIEHHGIKGMKWGIRRFQNKDGSLTPAGKIRYGSADANAGSSPERSKPSLLGSKGMKWGDRRYQNEDGSLTPAGRKRYLAEANRQANLGIRSQEYREKHTIPAGTTIYRTTADKNESLGGKKRVAYLTVDRNLDKGQLSRGARAYEKTYKLKEDLTVPSRKELAQVVYEAATKNRIATHDMMNAWYDMFEEGLRIDMERHHMPKAEVEKEWRKAVNDAVDRYKSMPVKDAYYIAFQSFQKNTDLEDSVITELKKRGYNAMVDEASVHSRYHEYGIDPLIIFDGESSLSEERTSKITERQWENATHKDFRWQIKPHYPKIAEWNDNSPGKIL